jgi:hypothetical protein
MTVLRKIGGSQPSSSSACVVGVDVHANGKTQLLLPWKIHATAVLITMCLVTTQMFMFTGISFISSWESLQTETAQMAKIGNTASDRTNNGARPALQDPNLVDQWPLQWQDWEYASVSNGTCNLPPSVPEKCCFGSTTEHGNLEMHYFGSMGSKCHKNVSDYMEMERRAVSLLPSLDDYSHITPTQQKCDVCRILDILEELGWTLSFVGDSVTQQAYAALECEFRRRGYNVSSREVYSMDGTNLITEFWRRSLSQHVSFRVHNSKATKTSTKSPAFRLFPLFRTNLDAVPLIVNHSDVILFDHGLHYTPKEMRQFKNDMLQFTWSMIDEGPQIPMIWRETSAQHFNQSDGYYLDYDTYNNTKQCVPFNITEYPQRHHHDVMRHVYNNSKPIQSKIDNTTSFSNVDRRSKLLRMIPFREYTSHFHDLHPRGDCTHFCYLPSFWLYLWRTLRLELEQVALDQKKMRR